MNELLLPCRFDASRKGPHTEYVYTFVKSLSAERMAQPVGRPTVQGGFPQG